MMYDYELLRSRRKTMALEITRDCRILVRAPMRTAKKTIDQFVSESEDWITKHMEIQRQKAAAAPPPPTDAEIQALKQQARTVLPEKVAYWSQQMGVIPTGLKITSAQKRYGSCSGKNSLCFSVGMGNIICFKAKYQSFTLRACLRRPQRRREARCRRCSPLL